MNIEYLADHMEHVPTLARWFHDEWRHLSPGCTLEERTERLRAKAQPMGIPIVFVAMEAGKPVGSASLVQCDMDTRSHLTPWLSSVYVASSFRQRGAGEALVARVLLEARHHGFASLYLWTPSAEAFYSKRGWQTLERTEYKKECAVVMEYSLSHELANKAQHGSC